MFYASILMVVAGGLLYHVGQKATLRGLNPLVSLLVMYLTALLLTALLLAADRGRPALAAGLQGLNWAPFAVGVSIVAIELGFLLAYRHGWNLNTAGVSANTAVAVLIVPVGVFFFREPLYARNVAGIVLCVAGLLLLLRE